MAVACRRLPTSWDHGGHHERNTTVRLVPGREDSGQQRWWDGNQWTDHVHLPATPPAAGYRTWAGCHACADEPSGHAPAATEPHPLRSPAAPPMRRPRPSRPVTGWMKAHKILTGILAFLVLLVILGLIGGGSEPPAPADATTGAAPAPDASPDPAPTAAPSTTAKASPTPTPSPTAKPTPTPTPTNPYGPQPPREQEFIKLAKTAMSDYENA